MTILIYTLWLLHIYVINVALTGEFTISTWKEEYKNAFIIYGVVTGLILLTIREFFLWLKETIKEIDK